MRYPELIPARICTIPVEVTIYSEEISEDGEPIIAFEGSFRCNFQDGAKTVLTDKQKKVELSGVAYFNGDIADKIPVISGGKIEIFGVTREILRGVKARNPDGTVNYTRLEVV